MSFSFRQCQQRNDTRILLNNSIVCCIELGNCEITSYHSNELRYDKAFFIAVALFRDVMMKSFKGSTEIISIWDDSYVDAREECR
ncbi:hypothetical protein Gasu2_27130 [Galdieria sulphuraria]|nr:hypothetical protein Gasu2_27130 [Galdieria sulphuraria]